MREELKEDIQANGIKQQQIADQLDVSKSLISRYLKGTRTLSNEKQVILRQILKQG